MKDQLSALLFAIVLACDTATPVEPTPAPPACGHEGELFGPCAPGLACTGDSSCLQPSATSSICVPPATEPSVDVQACAASLGALACSEAFGFCAIVCPSGQDSECGDGMICDPQAHLCAWPGAVSPWAGSTGEPPPGTNPTSTSTAATD